MNIRQNITGISLAIRCQKEQSYEICGEPEERSAGESSFRFDGEKIRGEVILREIQDC